MTFVGAHGREGLHVVAQSLDKASLSGDELRWRVMTAAEIFKGRVRHQAYLR